MWSAGRTFKNSGKEIKGFSLIELIIVLIIISLLVLLVTPTLTKTINHIETKRTAKRISSILRYCRSDAVNKKKVYQISFDTASGLVSILSGEEGEDQLTTQWSYSLSKDIRVEKIDVGETLFENSHPSFEFYPNGGSNGGRTVIRSGESKGYSIRVDFLTGSVKVEE